MKKDTDEELQRLEKELLELQQSQETLIIPVSEVEQAEKTATQEDLDAALLQEVLAQPAFEDMEQIHEPEEPLVYRNFSNAYGKNLEKQEQPTKEIPAGDKIDIGLMIAASGLCLGIIAVMIYWLVAYL